MPGNIHVPISFNIDGLTRSVQQINRLSGTLRKLGTAFVAVGTVAAAGIARFTGQSIQGAQELERNLEGLESVFKDSTAQMVEFSRSAANLGLSLSEAAKASTFIGSVLKQSGFAIQETADLTEDLVTLGADLALTFGYDIQESLLAMTALFRGEYDPIEKFGVAMKQSEIDSEKAARGLDGLTGAAERFADQQIRLELLMERSSDAQGALERQSENLAVKQMQLRSAFLNLRDTMTLDLLPVFAKLTGMMTDQLIRSTEPLQNAFAKLETPLLRIADQIGPVLENVLLAIADGVEALADFLTDATDPTTGLGDELQGLGNRLDLALEAITPVTEAIGDFFEGIYKWVAGDKNPIEFFVANINKVIDALSYLFTFLQVGIEQDALARTLAAFFEGGTNAAGPIVDEFFNEVESRMQNRANQLSEMNIAQDIEFGIAEQTRARMREVDEYLSFLENRIPEAEIDAPTIGDDDSATENAKDYAQEFFDKLNQELEKSAARLDLESLGLSNALIEDILNSQGWQEVYLTIAEGGEKMAERVQKAFNKTKAGMEELDDIAQSGKDAFNEQLELQKQIQQILDDLEEEILAIKKRFKEFREEVKALIEGVDVLETFAREIGKFERRTSADLDSIEKNLKDAFDNEMILEEAYNNLLEYARAELNALGELQRKRDELLAQRNFAAQMIRSVAQATTSAGELTRLLGDVTEKTTKIQVKELFEDVVKSADSLNGFKVTLERNFTEVVTETIDKTKQLTDNFQGVIDRTRTFIDNLNTLRELGLDPFLFNQLVEAGAEAGGATAQALVEGGSETVNEVNQLQSELEAMGVELGEMTYNVMKDQGEQFVSGIIDGLDAELIMLEDQATTMAEAFAEAFEMAYNKAINEMELQQISAAEARASQKIDDLIKEPVIDTAEIARLEGLVSGAARYAENIGDATKSAGAAFKSGIYSAAIEALQSGEQIDTSGLVSGLSSEELMSAAAQGMSVTYNNQTYISSNPLDGFNQEQATANNSAGFQIDNGTLVVAVGQ